MPMRKRISITIALLAASVLLFYFIALLTAAPSQISGNGNPGLIPIMLAIPVYLAFQWVYYGLLLQWFQGADGRFTSSVLLSVSAIMIWAVIGEMNDVQALLALLGDWNHPDSKLYRYPLLNQYTNTMFFNFYTFIGGMLLTTLSAVIYSYIRSLRAERAKLADSNEPMK